MGKKELTPAIRFKGFTDPWEQRKLGDLGSAYSGMTGKSRHDFGHGDARYITYLNVFSQPLLNDQIELGLTPVDRKQTEVKSGDALFTISSEVPEEIAISAVWQSTRENVYLNSFCFGVRPYRSCDSVYFAYALRSPSVRVSFMLLAQGISRYNISKLRALDVLLPWPSEDEQNNVGSFFARADRLITLHQRKLEKLQRMKQALLEKLFPKNGAVVPELRFNGFTDAWEQRKLGNIASLYQPHTISSDDLLPAGIPVFGANGYIGFYSEANHWVDQVTISARGEEAGTPNYVVSPAWITGNSMVVNTDSVEIDKKFLYFNLCATPLKKFVTGGAQPQLTRSVLGKAEIAVTVIVEERAISSILGCLSSLIALHQRKLEKLQQLKSAFLIKMFV